MACLAFSFLFANLHWFPMLWSSIMEVVLLSPQMDVGDLHPSKVHFLWLIWSLRVTGVLEAFTGWCNAKLSIYVQPLTTNCLYYIHTLHFYSFYTSLIFASMCVPDTILNGRIWLSTSRVRCFWRVKSNVQSVPSNLMRDTWDWMPGSAVWCGGRGYTATWK